MIRMVLDIRDTGGGCRLEWKSETFDHSTKCERDATRGIQDILERGILARTGKRNMARDGKGVRDGE